MRASGGPLRCQSGQIGRASQPCRSFSRTERRRNMTMSLDAAAQVMREAMRETVRRHSLWYLVQGGVMVLAGILALVYPIASSFAVVSLLGWLLIISGIVQGISLFDARNVPPQLGLGFGQWPRWDIGGSISMGQSSSDSDLAAWRAARYSTYLRRSRSRLFSVEGARKLTLRTDCKSAEGFSDRTRGFVVGGYRRSGLRFLKPLDVLGSGANFDGKR